MPDETEVPGAGQMVSLRNKIITIMAVVILLFGLGMIALTRITLTRILTKERLAQGTFLSKDIGFRSVDLILEGDLPELEEMIEEEIEHGEHFVYAFVTDAEGQVLAHSFEEGFPRELVKANEILPGQTIGIQLVEIEEGLVYDVAVPISEEEEGHEEEEGRTTVPISEEEESHTEEEGHTAVSISEEEEGHTEEVLGTAHVGISEEHIRRTVTKVAGAVMGVTALFMGVGILIALGLGNFITRPISELAEAARAVGSGDLERRVDIGTNDEIGQLGNIFNRMTADLKKATELTTTVTQNLTEGVMLLSKNFHILWANKKAKELSGLEEEDIIGNLCYQVTHARKEPCQPPHDMCPVKELMETGKPAVELHTHFDKEGNAHHVEVTADAVRDKNGDIVQFIHVTRDVTEMVKAKKELEKTYEEIKELNVRLEQKVEERTRELKQAQAQLVQSGKLAAIGQLGAGVAHELNNPVGGILGYAQYLRDKVRKLDDKTEACEACEKYLGYIEKEAERCKAIVANLLKFSRRSPERFGILNVNQVVEDTLALIGHQLMMKKIELKKKLASDLKLVEGNVNQLQQVFTNIVLNAQQAMPNGGTLTIATRLKVESRKFKVKDEKLSPETTFIEISFADTGCGIPPENLDKIFDPFFTTKMDWRGTGLGLSVSYEIIQNHKGKIEVASEVGKGTTLTISLPVKSLSPS